MLVCTYLDAYGRFGSALVWRTILTDIDQILALPYLCISASRREVPYVATVFLVLSVTLPAPILACNILIRSPVLVPAGLFENYNDPPSIVHRAPSPVDSVTTRRTTHEYKRSGSFTAVNSHCS